MKGIESLLNYQRRSLLSQGYVMTNHFKTNKKYGFQVAHYRFFHVASIIIVIIVVIIIIIIIIIIIVIFIIIIIIIVIIIIIIIFELQLSY